MSIFEDSYMPQLQGVSQRIPRERVDGQMTAQDNMLSDPVTGLRRRPGVALTYSQLHTGATVDNTVMWDATVGNRQVHVLVHTNDGVMRLLGEFFETLITYPANPYLVTPDSNTLQVATIGDEFFICNTLIAPTVGDPYLLGDSDKRGYIYVGAVEPDKWYMVRIYTSADPTGTTHGTTYSSGDPTPRSPEDIADDLVTSINLGTGTHDVTAVADGQSIYLSTSTATGLTVVSAPSPANGLLNPNLYTSGKSYITQAESLPSFLPAAADGYLIATGDAATPVYYRYTAADKRWLEAGDADSPLTLENMPIAIGPAPAETNLFPLLDGVYDGRFAGDDFTNPLPAFIRRGVTGMGSYQGRLVLLAGPMVCMSAARNPRQFCRSTITALLDSDPIEVGASAAASAAWQYAVQFDRDLVLLSEKFQGVVPGGDVAITPRTAAVLVVGTYVADMTAKPVSVGQTAMYASTTSRDFFGVTEMSQSPQLEQRYLVEDATPHLPRYMAGRCRATAASTAAKMAVFAPSGDRNSLVVHEFLWQGSNKVQQAWHRWTFRFPIACVYFRRHVLHIVFVIAGKVVLTTMDPRGRSVSPTGQVLGRLDFHVVTPVVGNVVDFTPGVDSVLADLRANVADGDLAGEPVGLLVDGGTLRTVPSFPEGDVVLGYPFISTISPTPPMRKDEKGVKISSNKMTVLRFMVGVANTGEFDVAIKDDMMPLDSTEESALTFNSPELMPGQPRIAKESTVIIPARTDANSTNLTISTDGVGELNLVSLEYVARSHNKIRRVP